MAKEWTSLELYDELKAYRNLLNHQTFITDDDLSALVDETMEKLSNHEICYDDVYDEYTELALEKSNKQFRR